MAFGQQSGPPASHTQLRELLALLQAAGHMDFRDARGAMGFTQRQAGGKFTSDEAAAFIDRLTAAAEGTDGADGVDVEPVAPVPRRTVVERSLKKYSSPELAVELRRRGWIVVEP